MSRYSWTDRSTNILLTFLDKHPKLFTEDRNRGYVAASQCIDQLDTDPLTRGRCNDFKVQNKLRAIYLEEDSTFRETIDFHIWLSDSRFRNVKWRAANIGACMRGDTNRIPSNVRDSLIIRAFL